MQFLEAAEGAWCVGTERPVGLGLSAPGEWQGLCLGSHKNGFDLYPKNTKSQKGFKLRSDIRFTFVKGHFGGNSWKTA